MDTFGCFGTTLNDMVKFILNNKKLLCEAVLEAENGKLFREGLMPLGLLVRFLSDKSNSKMFYEIPGESICLQYLV